jgi:plastocyanin
MTSFRRALCLLLAVLCLLPLAACSSGEKTGDESLLEFDQEQAEKLGGSTTTTTPAAGEAATSTTAAPTTTAPKAVVQTTTTSAPRATTTLPPEKQEVTLEVNINEQSPYFDPSVTQVLVGSKVRFTNKGTAPHSVVSDTGAFDSGQIKPGGVWIFEADRPGRYNFSDGGRPFAVGSIEVQ